VTCDDYFKRSPVTRPGGPLARRFAPEWCPRLDALRFPWGYSTGWPQRTSRAVPARAARVVDTLRVRSTSEGVVARHLHARRPGRLVLGLWAQAGIWSSQAAPVRWTAAGPAPGRALLVPVVTRNRSLARAAVAHRYPDVAELAAPENDAAVWRNFAAGNAVLAAWLGRPRPGGGHAAPLTQSISSWSSGLCPLLVTDPTSTSVFWPGANSGPLCPRTPSPVGRRKKQHAHSRCHDCPGSSMEAGTAGGRW